MNIFTEEKMINGVIVKQPDVHTDYRGDYWTTWKQDEWDLDFNHDKVSTSNYGVLREYMVT